MGNCYSTNSYDKLIENITRDEHECCFRGNENFEEVVYRKHSPKYENLTFQTIIARDWLDVDLEYMKSNYPKDNKYFDALKKPILKGVPNYLIRDVILSIFPINEIRAYNEYGSLIETIGDTSKLFVQPYFGRSKLSNLFLTQKGRFRCKRLLYVLSILNEDVEVSLILPRIVQILLWFLSEHEVYKVVSLLLEDKTYFPVNLEQHLAIANLVKGKIPSIIFQDIVFNIGIGYIHSCYYPQVLCYFLAEGINGVMKIAFAILQQNLNSINRLEIKYKDPRDIIRNFKKISVNNASISRILTQAYSVNLKLPAENNCLNDHYFPFGEQSVLLNTAVKTIKYIHFLPVQARQMKINLLKIKSFQELAMSSAKSFLIMIAENDSSLFGLFIDRPLGEMWRCLNSQCSLIDYNKKMAFDHLAEGEISVTCSQGFALTSEM